MRSGEQDNVFSEIEFTQASSEVQQEKGYDGCFMEDVKTIKANNGEILRKLNQFQKDFNQHRKNSETWEADMDIKMGKIMSVLGIVPDEESSQSVLGVTFAAKVPPNIKKGPPFLTLPYKDGTTEDLYIPVSVEKDILGSSVTREMLRKLMLHLHDHDIKFLRSCSRTGYTRSVKRKLSSGYDSDNELPTDDSVTTQLPIRTSLACIALFRKMNPVPGELDPYPELIRDKQARIDKDANNTITALLNYFKSGYDENGKRIQTVKKS